MAVIMMGAMILQDCVAFGAALVYRLARLVSKEADMRRTVLAIPLAVVVLIGWTTSHAYAQETKTAKGTVTAVTADSVTVKAGAQDMKFTVDNSTMVTATGAGTKTRKAAAEGKKPAVNELLTAGTAVEVKYHDMGGTLHAASIRTIASAGEGGGGVMADKPASKTATGTVKSVSSSSLVISDAGKDMTFTVDKDTKVIGKGLGTKGAASGGKLAITDALSSGDNVSVTYHDMGGTLHAATVRVTPK
jgi:hypothetical protein